MADNIAKVLIDADLTEQSTEKITEQFADAVGEGLSKASQTKFDFKNLKADLNKSLGQGLDAIWKSNPKVQEKQIKAAEKYKEAQKGVLDVINQQGGGFGKSLKLVGAIGKQGAAGMANMLANTNPYVAAVKVAAEAVKFMADQFQRIAKESSKFVGQGSLFTDKATMEMMQKTGQTATQAQATNRSLGDLGLSFEDIQSGKITSEQAAAFEAIRQRELDKLEEMNKVAGPMFKSMQQVTLGISLLMQDINDWITMAFAKSSGIENMIATAKDFLQRTGAFIKRIIEYLTPAMDIIGNIMSLIMNIIMAAMDAIQPLFDVIQPILEAISKVIEIIVKALNPLLRIVGVFAGIFGFLMNVLSPLGLLSGILEIVTPWLDKLSLAMEGLGAGLEDFFQGLRDVNIAGWHPFKDIGIGTSNMNTSYANQTTNNYIYGSQSMNTANPRQNNSDLFSNSYVLVND